MEEESRFVLLKLAQILRQNCSWASYNPNGKYLNISFTIKEPDDVAFIYNTIIKRYPAITVVFSYGDDNDGTA